MSKGWILKRFDTIATNDELGVTVTVLDYVSVLPVDDIREHVEEEDKCWCKPEVDYQYHPEQKREVPIYVHNAADQRELKENAS